ncbi:MAG TPA: DEAD/DEAH box helicase, partial [Thermopetrobacter sp.]|nr:DEAD/DEAH box helicase [Thermopetrobacter sp.]
MGPDTGQIADVLLPLKLDHPFSYRIRPEQSVNVGDIVRVSFGRRAEAGVVWRIHDAAPKARLKPIEARLDLPPMGEAQRRFVQWMADYYVSDPGSVLRLFIRSRELLREIGDQRVWRLTGQRPARLTPQRARVLAAAADAPPLSVTELAELAGVSPSVVRGLIELGCFSEEHRPKAAPFATPDPDRPRAAPLSAAQEEAARRLRDKARQGGFCATLLDGVTGAGKTEVYFEAMAEALRHGRQVLLLVPEIALTATFVRRVAERFGAEPALWHSAQSGGSRIRVHRAVAAGEARIVVAARSGLFLPWRDLGLIVVDEEHESAYKQEGGVPYHGRDMAVVLASLGRFPVILSSATPSLESLTNVERGKYDHVTLRERHGAAGLPAVRLLDLRRAPPEPGGW